MQVICNKQIINTRYLILTIQYSILQHSIFIIPFYAMIIPKHITLFYIK